MADATAKWGAGAGSAGALAYLTTYTLTEWLGVLPAIPDFEAYTGALGLAYMALGTAIRWAWKTWRKT